MASTRLTPLALDRTRRRCAGVEYALAEAGAVKTDLEYDPRDEAQRTRFMHIRKAQRRGLSDDDDDV